MSSVNPSKWTRRANLAWALLGPSVVLLIQLEALFIIADALGAIHLRGSVTRWSVAAAAAVLVLVTAAQISTAIWRPTHDARKILLSRRLDAESKLVAASRTETPDKVGPDNDTLKYGSRDRRQSGSPQAGRIKRYSLPEENRVLKAIIRRFGLEPTWAYQVLDDLGLEAARRLTRRTQLLDARAAGNYTAAIISGVALLAFSLSAIRMSHGPGFWIVLGFLYVLLGARAFAARQYRHEFLENEDQFYPQVEQMLELHRFDLYRALALQAPRDAHEERELPLARWRQGHGDARYALPGAPEQSDLREQVQGLTDLLRGPELVPYEGFVSWELRKDRIELVFARTPTVKAAGNARLQVEGSAAENHAPFDVTANSEDVSLVQVRASAQAPVDGRAARVTFNFTSRPDIEGRAPLIWFEIRQRGRFIQLLRVQAHHGSSSISAPAADVATEGS